MGRVLLKLLSGVVGGIIAFAAAGELSAQVRQDSTRADTLGQVIEAVTVRALLAPAATGGAAAVAVKPLDLKIKSSPLLVDVLRATPFLLVRENSRGETELSLRGSESRQMAISLDGLPLTLGWDHRADPSVIPMTGVQSVTVVRGLSSLLHGPNVLGGVLSLGMSDGTSVRAAPAELSLSTGVDADGAYSASAVAGTGIAMGSGSISLRAGGGHRERDGLPMAGRLTDQYSSNNLRSGTDLSHSDAFLTLRYNARGGAYAGVTATGYRTSRGVAPELHIDEPRFWKYPNQARTLAVLSLGTPLMATPLGHGKLDIRSGYSRGTIHIEQFANATYSTVTAEERGDERLINTNVLLTHTAPFGSTLTASFTGGVVNYREILDNTHSNFEQRLWSTGVELNVPLSSALEISGGIVNDASTTPETAGREALPRRGATGWRVGGSMIALRNRVRVHASASSRSRFPALRELYSGALDRFQSNPDLMPETITGVELGVSMMAQQTTARVIDLQAVLFHHNIDDAVVRTTLPDSRFLRVNRDGVRSTGLELLGSSTPLGAGVSLSGDVLVQSISVTDNIAGAPRLLEHQPELKARLELGSPLGFGVTGSAIARHTGKSFCLHPGTGAAVTLRAQTTGDASISRDFRLARSGLLSTMRAIVGVDNVTDAVVYDQCGLPQPGRGVRLGVRFS